MCWNDVFIQIKFHLSVTLEKYLKLINIVCFSIYKWTIYCHRFDCSQHVVQILLSRKKSQQWLDGDNEANHERNHNFQIVLARSEKQM